MTEEDHGRSAARKVGRTSLPEGVAFLRHTFRAFSANQGLLLAGAVAYHALLSLVLLLALAVLGLSHLVDRGALMEALPRYLEWLVPSRSKALVADVSAFVDKRATIGFGLLATMLFFSSLAFSILEKAMAAIFSHRTDAAKRHFIASAVLPYGFVLVVGLTLLGITVATIVLQTLTEGSVRVGPLVIPPGGAPGVLLYLLGIGTEVAIRTLLYLLLPRGARVRSMPSWERSL